MESGLPRLYFIRHGRSTHNESSEHRPLIWDAPLHKKGLRQASILRRRLEAVPLDLCVSSPLARALQTALISIGGWGRLEPGSHVATPHGDAVVEMLAPTVHLDSCGVRFDASDDEIEAMDRDLAPGARVRLRRGVTFVGGEAVEPGELGTVTNATMTLRQVGSDARLTVGCLDVRPRDYPLAGQRCPVVAWPEASERLCESDDIGSTAPELRQRFPQVDFAELPADGTLWWYGDPRLPDSLDANKCRRCWEREDYEEPEVVFAARVAQLVKRLRSVVAGPHARRHVAVFAHCWVLEEVWKQCCGQGKRFDNAELAVVDVLPSGAFREIC